MTGWRSLHAPPLLVTPLCRLLVSRLPPEQMLCHMFSDTHPWSGRGQVSPSTSGDFGEAATLRANRRPSTGLRRRCRPRSSSGDASQ